MRINIYSIAKKDSKYKAIEDEFIVQCKSFGTQMQVIDLLPNSVLKAQKISAQKAQEAYSCVFKNYLSTNALNLALDPNAQSLDSVRFAKLIESHTQINCFIGGAYGFEKEFLLLCQSLSLSPLTLSHKIAKIVLCEQIYRALSLLNHHPYHK